jgi:hypothetical protein
MDISNSRWYATPLVPYRTRTEHLWSARIPSGSHLTEMLALICSAYGTWKTREASQAEGYFLPADLSADWILCLS